MTDKDLIGYLDHKETQWVKQWFMGNDVAFVKSAKINFDEKGNIDRFRSQVTFSLYFHPASKDSAMEYRNEDYNSLKFFVEHYTPKDRIERGWVLSALERSIEKMRVEF